MAEETTAEWTRIADDLRATTDKALELRVETREGAWRDIDVVLDGQPIGTFGHDFAADPESFLAQLADDLREFTLDEEVGGGWPTCPEHHTHPLEARTDNSGRAVWICPRGSFVVAIGSLTVVG